MADPIERLRQLSAAPPVPPPPTAAEIRRHGDRLRRRRHLAVGAAAACAAILLGAPVALLAGGTDRAVEPPPATRTPEPSPDESQPTGSPAPVDEIPADFPLDSGMSSATVTDDDAMAGLDYCGRTPLTGLTPLDVRSASLSGGETAVTRTLYLLESPEAAVTAHQAVTGAARECAGTAPEAGDAGDVRVHPGEGAWPGTSITEDFARGVSTTEPSVEVVHVVDRGAALLVTSTFGSWTGDLAGGVARTREETRPVVTAMQVFGEPGAAEGQQSQPGASVGTSDDIPADFPLEAGHLDLTGDGGELLGPAPDVPGLSDEQLCGADLWKVPATGRLAFSSTGPEYADVRELRTFATVDDAISQMTELRASFAGCDRELREGTTLVWTTYDEATGYDSATIGSTADGALGGVVYQVTRVGRAVLAVAVDAEWSLDTAPSGVRDLTATTRRIAPAMCAFTEAGC